jgi:flagellar basal-body rod protein FlgF
VDSGLYAACAGLKARVQHLDVVGNNLANVNTTGYRSQQPTFSSLLAMRSGAIPTELNLAVNDFGVLQGSRIDLMAGNLEHTGNQLDLGIEGKAFFTVQTRSGVLYTRNGAFRTSPSGRLNFRPKRNLSQSETAITPRRRFGRPHDPMSEKGCWKHRTLMQSTRP